MVPTLAQLEWLASPEGCQVCSEMAADRPADTPKTIEQWRQRLEPEQVSTAWSQVLLRSSAKSKFSRAEQMLLDRVGMEQSSDEVVATHKAKRFAGFASITDLCCGIGGDSLALAAQASVTAVDLNGPRVMMAEHNARVYGHRITGVIADVTFTQPDAAAAHIDPDRRPTGRRSHQIDQGSPDLPVLEAIVRRYQNVAIKLSPGVDFSRLPFEAEVELISHRGQCKQAVVWTGQLRERGETEVTNCKIASTKPLPRWRATVLPGGESISAATDDELRWPESRPITPDGYLLEPDAAVIRAHLVGPLARLLECHVIDPRIAWLIADRPIASPFVDVFQVIDVVPFSEKKLRPWLNGHDIGSVDIKTRGSAVSPDDILRRLRLSGRRHGILFITRLGNRPTAILAQRHNNTAGPI